MIQHVENANDETEQSANNGQMVMEVAPKAPVADALRELCRAITGRSVG